MSIHHGSGGNDKFIHMRPASTPQRFLATSLGLLLVSCGAARSAVPSPTSAQELSRSVLVIQETPDGQVTHSWEPLSRFDLSKYPYPASNSSVEGPIVRTAWTRDCEDEFEACVKMCVASLRGRNWSHANRASKTRMCHDRCRPAYNDCCRLRDQAETLKFPTGGQAVNWLKQHREELVVGTVVVIAGVTFIVVVGGSGGLALLLVPAFLVASAEVVPSEPPIVEVKP